MNNSKGLAFTTFSILAASLIVTMVAVQTAETEQVNRAEADRIGEASFFLQSVFSDMDRSLGIATRRAMTGVTNYVVLEGEALEAPKDNLSEALVNGTLGGESLNGTENASLSKWSSRVSGIAAESNYDLSMHVENYSFEEGEMSVQSSFTVFASLTDSISLATFNRTRSASTEVSIEGLEDTMLLLESQGRYVNQYSSCSFSDPADVLYTGDQNSSSTFHGYAAKKPSDISSVSNRSEKILVVENVDSHSESEVEEYGGVVSASSSSDPENYTTNYVFGTSSVADIDQNMSLILHDEQVWRSGFREMIGNGCYVSDPNAPRFFERLAGRTAGGGEGYATLIDITELPSELQETDSAVGYVYFNDSGSFGSLNEISGVTGEYSWFRLDQDHVDYWSLNDLVK